MKKVITFIMTLVLVVSVAGCGSSESKYEYEHIGIYDTKTEQYVDIGDSKDKVDRILGTGTEGTTFSNYTNYADDLTIGYDDAHNVESLSVNYDPEDGETGERYALSDGFGYTDTVTDFIEKYPYVYSCDIFQNGQPGKNVCVIVQKTENNYCILSKEKLMEMSENNISTETLYRIQVDYDSYDSLLGVGISIVPDNRKWDKYLVDIEK